MPVKGISKVRRNLKIEADKISGEKTDRALYAILSQGAALAAMKTPVDEGNLLRSQTAPNIKDGTGTIGYGASYAAAVHDAPGKLKGQPRAHFGETAAGVKFGGGTGNGTYWSPNAEPKFLEKGFEELKPAIPAILKAIYGV